MKILYILNIANKVNNFSYTSMISAQSLGWEFQIAGNWGYASEDERVADEKKYGIKIYQVDFQRNPFDIRNISAYKKIKEIITNESIDIVHCNTPIGGVCGRFAGKKCGVDKIIYQAHGFHFYKGAPLLNWLLYYPVERLLAHYTDVLITINREDFALAQKFKLRRKGKVYYVPGVGIDLKAYEKVGPDSIRTTVRQELKLGENAIVSISMGDLIPRKNYGIAIAAMGQLCEKQSNLHFLICGRGPELDNLKEQAVSCGIKENVHFLGFRNDIKMLLQASDFFLLTSLQEGLPRSTMEAMASSLPLVCSRIRGNTDLIDEGQGGFMFDPTNVDDCVQAVEKLLSSDYEAMGKYNLDRVREFRIEAVSAKLTSIYQDECAKMSEVVTDLSE